MQRPIVRTPPISIITLALAAASLSGCRVIEGIFKAGIGVGVVAVILVLTVVGGAYAMLKR